MESGRSTVEIQTSLRQFRSRTLKIGTFSQTLAPECVDSILVHSHLDETLTKIPPFIHTLHFLIPLEARHLSRLPNHIRTLILTSPIKQTLSARLPLHLKQIIYNCEVSLEHINALPSHIHTVGLGKRATPLDPHLLTLLPMHITKVIFHCEVEPEQIHALPLHIRAIGLGSEVTPEMVKNIPPRRLICLYSNISAEAVAAIPPDQDCVAICDAISQKAMSAIPLAYPTLALYVYNQALSTALPLHVRTLAFFTLPTRALLQHIPWHIQRLDFDMDRMGHLTKTQCTDYLSQIPAHIHTLSFFGERNVSRAVAQSVPETVEKVLIPERSETAAHYFDPSINVYDMQYNLLRPNNRTLMPRKRKFTTYLAAAGMELPRDTHYCLQPSTSVHTLSQLNCSTIEINLDAFTPKSLFALLKHLPSSTTKVIFNTDGAALSETLRNKLIKRIPWDVQKEFNTRFSPKQKLSP